MIQEGIMQKPLKMPTQDELAELSHVELNECIHVAFDQWVEAMRRGEEAAEKKAIHKAYDTEQFKRLKRVEKYLKYSWD